MLSWNNGSSQAQNLNHFFSNNTMQSMKKAPLAGVKRAAQDDGDVLLQPCTSKYISEENWLFFGRYD